MSLLRVFRSHPRVSRPKIFSQYVHPTGTHTTPKLGYPPKVPLGKGVILGKEGSIVPDGCAYCTALRRMKGTYIGSPSMIVSIFDQSS